jgi:nucleoside-diphosphate-sugar epimerase
MNAISVTERTETPSKSSHPKCISFGGATARARLYALPLDTLQINTVGTANLLEAIRRAESIRLIVVVTTDKCCENRGWEYGYRENRCLGGYDAQ